MVASVFNGSTTDGSTVILFPFQGDEHQKWEMIPDAGGWFQLRDMMRESASPTTSTPSRTTRC
ncbi:RICIN domain-containing protein [Streptomyces mutabilis]|uniref:RICIN domain-containing protein n=1 Tax=Streptomyces mutabilis TaxID=67332 RepID=UPI0034DF9D8C